ncbi:MAG: recombination regulator RecX [Gallionellaceae bacterium]|nr:recombination regulator RecX [Gallionellaceae bacterium]
MRKRSETSLRTRALQYLARREYSRTELRGKLLPHVRTEGEIDAVPTEELDALLDDLTARGWLSDTRAVTQLLHARRSRFGAQRIAQELRHKGVAEDLIAEALPQLKETEFEAAREVWLKKFGVLPQDRKEKARQMRFLQSRGFAMEVIFKVMELADSAEAEQP